MSVRASAVPTPGRVSFSAERCRPRSMSVMARCAMYRSRTAHAGRARRHEVHADPEERELVPEAAARRGRRGCRCSTTTPAGTPGGWRDPPESGTRGPARRSSTRTASLPGAPGAGRPCWAAVAAPSGQDQGSQHCASSHVTLPAVLSARWPRPCAPGTGPRAPSRRTGPATTGRGTRPAGRTGSSTRSSGR